MANTAHAARRAARKTISDLNGMISDAQDKGIEAVDAVREVGANIADAIDESLEKRPYTTLILALAIGFLFGASWRR